MGGTEQDRVECRGSYWLYRALGSTTVDLFSCLVEKWSFFGLPRIGFKTVLAPVLLSRGLLNTSCTPVVIASKFYNFLPVSHIYFLSVSRSYFLLVSHTDFLPVSHTNFFRYPILIFFCRTEFERVWTLFVRHPVRISAGAQAIVTEYFPFLSQYLLSDQLWVFPWHEVRFIPPFLYRVTLHIIPDISLGDKLSLYLISHIPTDRRRFEGEL
jgi:hypothetical protein